MTGPKLHWLPAIPDTPGRVAISARPRGGDWLADEIAGWKQSGIRVVVSLLTLDEETELELLREAEECRVHEIEFVSLPITDRTAPESDSPIPEIVADLVSRLAAGEAVAIHCRQGIGRSGLLAAAILMALGATADDAVREVSNARGLRTPETPDQLEWLRRFEPLTSHTSGLT